MSKLNVTLTLVWCLLGVVHGFTYDDKEVETEDGKAGMFERWRSHHKMEGIGPADKKKQYENFKANLKHVHTTNKANKPYKLEMNRFAGMTHQELKSKYTGLRKPAPPPNKLCMGPGPDAPFRYRNLTNLPPSIDWRTLGAVTLVKNQAHCGSCYAFSAIDAVEGMHFIKTKELIELSTKEIVDCAKEGVGGCQGGFMTATFEYIEKNGGVTTAKNYPYQPKMEPCNVQKEHDIAVPVGGHEVVPWDEESLMKAVANQPVSVSVAVEEAFGLYKEGVLSSPCPSDYMEVDHAVLLVGYDTDPDGTKYWIIKNSWGENWGDKGYIKMLRGVPEKEGYCGITTLASYPTPDKTCAPPKDPNEPMVHESKEL